MGFFVCGHLRLLLCNIAIMDILSIIFGVVLIIIATIIRSIALTNVQFHPSLRGNIFNSQRNLILLFILTIVLALSGAYFLIIGQMHFLTKVNRFIQ